MSTVLAISSGMTWGVTWRQDQARFAAPSAPAPGWT